MNKVDKQGEVVMKNSAVNFLTSLFLAVLMLAAVAGAQQSERVIKADIPFDFTVGNRILPAGRYAMVRTQPWLLEVRDSEGRFVAHVLTQSIQTLNSPAAPKLRFENKDGRPALTQVWQENDSIGQQLLPRNSETRAVQKRSAHVQTAKVADLQ
jgi:hypothetical protein